MSSVSGGANVLIVDDDPAAQRLFSDALAHKYAVSVVSDGGSALQHIEQSGTRVDLMLLDVQLPDMSGFDVVQRLRKVSAGADIPVIFTTNESAIEREMYAFQLGASDYLVKPVMFSVLMQKIEALLGRQQRLFQAKCRVMRSLSAPDIQRRWRALHQPGNRARVLIVDDNPADRLMLEECLGSEQYVLLFASSGAQALEIAQTEDTRIDLCLLDLMLADMSGYEVLEGLRLRAATARTPVIIASARTRGVHIVNGLRQGALDYFTKPCRPGLVDARVRHHLREDSKHRFYEELAA